MLFVVFLLLLARFLSQSDFVRKFSFATGACASTLSGLFLKRAKTNLDSGVTVTSCLGLLALRPVPVLPLVFAVTQVALDFLPLGPMPRPSWTLL